MIVTQLFNEVNREGYNDTKWITKFVCYLG